MLLNPLSNAINFNGAGGLLRVDTAMSAEMLTVSGDGVGISPQDQARVFRPFEHGKNYLDRTHEGTGLGLALCKLLMELESEEGRGTTITFHFPQGTFETNEIEPVALTGTS